MANQVLISYNLPSGVLEDKDLDEVIELTERMRKGIKSVQSEYSQKDYFKKVESTITHPTCSGFYNASFSGSSRKEVSNAVSKFMELCGTPDVVRDEHDLVNTILQQYDKTVGAGPFKENTHIPVLDLL